MKERFSSSINFLLLTYRAAGTILTGCQRARQQDGFCDRTGNKTTKRMLYDLIADFYEKSSDRHPKYIVLMGTYNENTFDEMKILGFQEDSDSNASFQDYVMDGADENFLQEYTKDGYQSEMLDVLYSDVNYEKIQVRALADEALDDEGRHAPLGVVMGDMFVHFTASDPMTPVWFEN